MSKKKLAEDFVVILVDEQGNGSPAFLNNEQNGLIRDLLISFSENGNPLIVGNVIENITFIYNTIEEDEPPTKIILKCDCGEQFNIDRRSDTKKDTLYIRCNYCNICNPNSTGKYKETQINKH